MGSIIVTSGQQRGEFLPLGRRTSVIGRDEAISLQILDARVSRKHLRISYDKITQHYYADDMNSKHGVFVNKRRITDTTVLTDGDEILIGNIRLLYTDKEFSSYDSALMHYKLRGQRERKTVAE